MDGVKGLLKHQVLMFLDMKDKKISVQQLRKAFYCSCTIEDPANIWVFQLIFIYIYIYFYDYTLMHYSNYSAGSHKWHLMTKVLPFTQ